MVDLDPKSLKQDIEQEAYRQYEQLSGVRLARRADGSFQPQGHNDEIDAFRHAFQIAHWGNTRSTRQDGSA